MCEIASRISFFMSVCATDQAMYTIAISGQRDHEADM